MAAKVHFLDGFFVALAATTITAVFLWGTGSFLTFVNFMPFPTLEIRAAALFFIVGFIAFGSYPQVKTLHAMLTRPARIGHP